MCIDFSAFNIGLITNDRGGTMNGAATVTASEDHQHQHQQAQNETTSDHPRSPASPLSVRHGELILRKFTNAERNKKLRLCT